MKIRGGSPLRTLLIECVTDTAFIAAHSADRYAHRHAQGKATHSTKLFSLIEESLAECGITVRDVELICAGIGPGSFTGIRIGLATARMLAQVLSVPLVGLKSTEIYAASLAKNPGDQILAAFDAKKGRVFGGLYRVGEGNVLEEIVTPGDYYPEEFASHIDNTVRTVIAGDGAERYREVFSKGNQYIEIIEGFMPDGKSAIDLALRAYATDPGSFTDIEKVLPFYARKSDAEVLKEEKERGLR